VYKKYCEKEFVEMIINSQLNNSKEFYQQSFINYSGETSDTNRKFTEILAEKLYNEEIKINATRIDDAREKQTTAPLHNKENIKYTLYKPTDMKRNEENIAKRIFELGCSTKHGGDEYVVEDYQVPVNRVNHSKDGKIDLILTSVFGAIIGELKDNKSHESLLRAILEVETYYNKVSHDKLKKCYNKIFVGKAILLFEGTRPYKEFESNVHKWTNKLLSRLDIAVLLVESTSSMDNVLPQDNDFKIRRVN